MGLYIFRSGIPYAVDFTLSFDTSFAPIEALLDVRTSTFTAKTVFFIDSFLFIFAYNMGLFFWFNVSTISIKMCRRFKMSQKLFLQVIIVMYLSPLFGGGHFFSCLKSTIMSLCRNGLGFNEDFLAGQGQTKEPRGIEGRYQGILGEDDARIVFAVHWPFPESPSCCVGSQWRPCWTLDSC